MTNTYFDSQLQSKAHLKAARLQTSRLHKNYGAFIDKFKEGNVLEIGPGRGELLSLFPVSDKVNLVALDIDEGVIGHIGTHLPHVNAVNGDAINILKNSNDKFDLVFMLHVLEHLETTFAVELLEQIGCSLVEGGSLIMEVPNNACTFVGNSIQSADYTHVAAYNSLSLEQICVAAGLKVIKVMGIRPKGKSPVRLIQRLLFGCLIGLDKAIHKILIPAWDFKHEPTIYIHCKKG